MFYKVSEADKWKWKKNWNGDIKEGIMSLADGARERAWV